MEMTSSTLTGNGSDQLSRWLILSVIAMIVGGVTGIGYFTIGGIMAPISDTFAFLIGVTLIPVTLGIHHQLQSAHRQLSVWARAIGLIGHALFALSGLGLVFSYFAAQGNSNPLSFGSVSFGIQLLGVFLEGGWLLMVGVLCNRGHHGPWIVYSAYVAGIGNILFVMGTILRVGGIAGAGGFLGLIAFVAWALRYRSFLVSRETPKVQVELGRAS
jgi:hypothetical protein